MQRQPSSRAANFANSVRPFHRLKHEGRASPGADGGLVHPPLRQPLTIDHLEEHEAPEDQREVVAANRA